MRFLVDNNVCISVSKSLRELNQDVVLVSDIMSPDSPDQVVATAAVQDHRILVSHDKDMRHIERRISEAFRARYPTLSRLMLCCPEWEAADRLSKFFPAIDLEFRQAAEAGEPMRFEIALRRVRIHR